MIKKLICHNCGSVNQIDTSGLRYPSVLDEVEEEWLECTEPQGFEWKLPAGKITPIFGEPIYISAGGERLSHAEYVAKYNVDPEIALTRMRGMKNTVRDSARTGEMLAKGEEQSKVPQPIRNLINRLNKNQPSTQI